MPVTNKVLVVVNPTTPISSLKVEDPVMLNVSSIIVEKAFSDLKAPIKKVTPPHSPVPYAPNLEQAFLPSSQNVIDAVKEVIRGEK